MAIINATRAYEDVYLEDPAENPDTPRFRVWLDDRSIEEMLGKIKDAVDRAQEISRRDAEAKTDEERAEVNRMMARHQRRVISAVIGADGYRTVLEWMGGGEAIDPDTHVRQLGEVYGALLTMVARKATSEQLRECGMYFSEQSRRGAGAARGGGRQQFRAVDGKAGGKKKHRR